MCGITGFHQYQAENDLRIQVLRKMLTRIRHRGPDESGIYLSKNIGLGSVRLSIIDLSSGTMPLSNSDKSYWVVFNGEIFNYIELRVELTKRGHNFETHSDTEVIVHLYEEYGPEFVHKLNGQFAIAIWDKKKEELFLARDRVGIRPLFYTNVNNSFLFASEIKSFLEFPGFKAELSPKAISEYFTFWTSISPNTIFKDVYELPPGSYLIRNSKGIKIKPYWQLPVVRENEYEYNDVDQAIEAFDAAFSNAVKLRLRADVPVAAYLSGGIDSSVTTSYIKDITPEALQTFSIGFTEKDYDESSYQNIASEYFKTKHASISCSPNEIAENFQHVVWHSEAPLLRTAPTPMSLLAKNVRAHNIKVVITGEGADELLGGYNIFKETKIRHFWAKDPKSKYRPLLLKNLYPYLPQLNNANSNVLKMFFGFKLNETCSPIYSHLLRWNNTSRINNYLSEEYKEAINGYKPIEVIEEQLKPILDGYDFLSKAQKIEINFFMSGYLLSSQGDRMAMANSVEGRYPFLDHNVIELCMNIHPDLKLKGLNEKFLLKKMMKGRLPDEILNRPKQAYRAPIKSTFISNSIPNYLKRMLLESEIDNNGIFNTALVKQLTHKMETKSLVSEIDNMALTGILSTQIINDLFVKKNIDSITENQMLECKKVIIE